MQILITGGAGFIGSHSADAALAAVYTVEDGRTMVRAMRPDSVLGMLRLPELAPDHPFLREAGDRLVVHRVAPAPGAV